VVELVLRSLLQQLIDSAAIFHLPFGMATRHNKSLYVDENCELLVLARDDNTEPQEPDELLIETLYSGVNPADVKHGTILGIRSTVMGYDFCGKVLSASLSRKFAKGDVVMGLTPSGIGRPLRFGTHQTYLSCPEDMLRKVPSNLPESHAAALTVVGMTAADALYNLFKFPLPDSPNPQAFSGPLLIWGASSGVGVCTIQLARASGCQHIFVTASPARHELLRKLGATHCFDYASSTVVSEIGAAVEKLGQGPILHAFDAVGTGSNPSSADLMAGCVTDSTAIFISSIFRTDQRFLMPFAIVKDDWHIHLTGSPTPMTIPGRPADYERAWGALQWAVDHYGTGFTLPSVEVLSGSAGEALQVLVKAANSELGFGKFVIQHPMN